MNSFLFGEKIDRYFAEQVFEKEKFSCRELSSTILRSADNATFLAAKYLTFFLHLVSQKLLQAFCLCRSIAKYQIDSRCINASVN